LRDSFTFAELCRLGHKKYKGLAELTYQLRYDPFTAITCEQDLKDAITRINPQSVAEPIHFLCGIVGGEEKY